MLYYVCGLVPGSEYGQLIAMPYGNCVLMVQGNDEGLGVGFVKPCPLLQYPCGFSTSYRFLAIIQFDTCSYIKK